jgi:hypothetical protein
MEGCAPDGLGTKTTGACEAAGGGVPSLPAVSAWKSWCFTFMRPKPQRKPADQNNDKQEQISQSPMNSKQSVLRHEAQRECVPIEVKIQGDWLTVNACCAARRAKHPSTRARIRACARITKYADRLREPPEREQTRCDAGLTGLVWLGASAARASWAGAARHRLGASAGGRQAG